MILVSLWTQTDFGVIFKIIQIYERYVGANKMQIEQHWVIGLTETVSYSSKEIGNNNNHEETTELEKRHSEISPEYWLVKGRLNFSSKTTTVAKIPFSESLLDNWLKNNNISVDKICYLRSLFVSFFYEF